MIRIKAIPGLGLDARIFQHLSIEGADIEAFDHIEPTSDEAWQDYIGRYTAHVGCLGDCYLMGHSMGGIIAQEMAARTPIKGIILVSTIAAAGELPPTLAIMRSLPAYQLLLREVVKRTYWLWGEKDGYNTADERQIYYDMTDKLSDYYFRWSVQQLVHWTIDPESITCPILRLHGTADRVFAHKYISLHNTNLIAGGSHIMIKSMPSTLSPIIADFCTKP